ncbi:hypothetical protein OROHE_019797 [Orobanche hederae]
MVASLNAIPAMKLGTPFQDSDSPSWYMKILAKLR